MCDVYNQTGVGSLQWGGRSDRGRHRQRRSGPQPGLWEGTEGKESSGGTHGHIFALVMLVRTAAHNHSGPGQMSYSLSLEASLKN